MQRTTIPKVIINKEGWREVIIEDDFVIPVDVVDPQAYILREKLLRYLNNHPNRIYRYFVDGVQHTADCKSGSYLLAKQMRAKGASEEDVQVALDIASQFHSMNGKVVEQSRKALQNGKSSPNGILSSRAEELLDLFGRLYSVDEVHRIAVQDWNLSVHVSTIRAFYARNLKEIERLRDQYSSDFSDISLTKKRARLDKLSFMFYTYFNKWYQDERLDYSRELRAILDQIKKEVEGELITVDVKGQINVDMTIEANKTLYDAYKRVPINNLIVAMVAAKRGIDPTRLMTQLTSSYYNSLTGFSKFEPEKQLIHPVDLTYNWNEIERKHRERDPSLLMIEDAKIVQTTGSIESDAEINTMKNKLMELLERDKQQNSKRKSR